MSHVDEAWSLTARMSPRRSVRLLTDAGGNRYATARLLTGEAPECAWAMHLADESGYFRWLCFDLDAKNGNVTTDARLLRRLLRRLQIRFLECVSGDSGGRHFWVSADRLHPQLVALLGRLAKSLLPSLDISMLNDRGTGAVRPPFTPHRLSGYSRPLGDVEGLFGTPALTDPTATALIELLETEGALDRGGSRGPVAGVRGVVLDADGNPRLAGARREPSTRIAYLLEHGRPAPGDPAVFPTASELQFTVLCGLVRARWSYRDVAKLMDSPALAHAASAPHGQGRKQRAPRRAATVLRWDWSRAVDVVSSNPSHTQTDPDAEIAARILTVTQAVHAAQGRADASPGRWGANGPHSAVSANRGRPSDRSVLDAVCWYMLRAARLTIEVNTRRLAKDTGYSREACRLALNALISTDAPWLVRTAEADGPHAASYTLHPRLFKPSGKFSTEDQTRKLAQGGVAPAAGTTLPTWRLLSQELEEKLATLAQDVFCAPHSLGRAAGRVLQCLPAARPASWTRTLEIAARLGSPVAPVHRSLRRLHWAGLVHRQPLGWMRAGPDGGVDPAETAGVTIGVDGYLAARAETYAAEQRRWEWWLAELTWKNSSRDERRQRRRERSASPTTLPGMQAAGPPEYPRKRDRTPNHAQALFVARMTRPDADAIAA